MNVEKKLHQIKSQFPQHTVDRRQFSESFWRRVENRDRPRTVKQMNLKWIAPSAAVLVIGGATFSPVIASAVQEIPFVQVVTDWVKGTPSASYVRDIQQSATDHGITMTITDVLYGPSELALGYTVSPGGDVSLDSPNGMAFFVNGKQVHLQEMGDNQTTSYGTKGLVTLTDDGTNETLPESFQLQIVLHKIGNLQGTWKFSVPVSRKNMKADEAFFPFITKKVGNETITIKEVQFYPTGGTIDYEVTAPAGETTLSTLGLLDQNKHILDSVTSDVSKSIAHVTSGTLETWSFSQSFRIPNQRPTSLIVVPSNPSAQASAKIVPLSGPFPVSMDYGMFGELVVTDASVSGKQVVVHFKYVGADMESGPHFSVHDVTNPNQNFGASLGESDGPRGSDQYKAVYEFSNDVSSDKLVLQFPTPIKNVFQVPLAKN